MEIVGTRARPGHHGAETPLLAARVTPEAGQRPSRLSVSGEAGSAERAARKRCGRESSFVAHGRDPLGLAGVAARPDG
jgi:hypothetical protein